MIKLPQRKPTNAYSSPESQQSWNTSTRTCFRPR